MIIHNKNISYIYLQVANKTVDAKRRIDVLVSMVWNMLSKVIRCFPCQTSRKLADVRVQKNHEEIIVKPVSRRVASVEENSSLNMNVQTAASTLSENKHALFRAKVATPESIQKYYDLAPQVVNETHWFNDQSDFLTAEDAAFLLDSDIKKMNCSNDCAHVAVIENDEHYSQTKNYLSKTVSLLKDGGSIKLLLKRDFCPHFFAVYIRKIDEKICLFAFDPGLGIALFENQTFSPLVQVFKEVIASLDSDFKIVTSSALVQADKRNCSVFSYKATRYFIKHGHRLFASFSASDFVPNEQKVCSKEESHIVHLKVTSLPAGLCKGTQRHLCSSINRVYENHVEEVLTKLSDAYFESGALKRDASFWEGSSEKSVNSSSKPTLTLKEYINKKTKPSSIGKPWNFAAIDGMLKARKRIKNLLKEKQIIDSDDRLDQRVLGASFVDLSERVLFVK